MKSSIHEKFWEIQSYSHCSSFCIRLVRMAGIVSVVGLWRLKMRKEKEKSNTAHECWVWNSLSTTPYAVFVVVSYLNHIIAFSSLPPSFLRVDLVSLTMLNLAFFISLWLGVGNACSLVCTPPVTLEVGLRTIPSVVSSFRYLSTNSIVPGPGSI